MISTSSLDTVQLHSLTVQLGTAQQGVMPVRDPRTRLIDGSFKSIIKLIELLGSLGRRPVRSTLICVSGW
ncbi:hypothetical protein [Pseudomonas fluorescens]|uniref:hypothetical protein n=1 Tax=Pseudomonas fluorescens TaxID=294 RepID=UPI000A9181B6|nr:hypothetical protein [Pseudomonas fluorescens]